MSESDFRMEPIEISPLTRAQFGAAHTVNQKYESLLSPVTMPEFEALVAASPFARQAFGGAAFIVAFDESSSYSGENFNWFKERYGRFLYIDRVAVDDVLQGRGIAKLFYDHAIEFARIIGAVHLCAEVNIDPPNAASTAFHVAMGFVPVGEARVGHKYVQYFALSL
ncbi:MAG: GNAT family N-acetyltransferase [Pseudomonadota bacterium]